MDEIVNLMHLENEILQENTDAPIRKKQRLLENKIELASVMVTRNLTTVIDGMKRRNT